MRLPPIPAQKVTTLPQNFKRSLTAPGSVEDQTLDTEVINDPREPPPHLWPPRTGHRWLSMLEPQTLVKRQRLRQWGTERLETKIKAAALSSVELIGSREEKCRDEVAWQEASDSHRRPPEPADWTGITIGHTHTILKQSQAPSLLHA